MHVALLTIHHGQNYGALIQAYSLREVLMHRGHEVQVIDYRPGPHDVHDPRARGRRLGRSALQAAHGVVYAVNAGHRAQGEFERFVSDEIGVGDGPRIRDADTALAAASQADVVVIGSDQVWRPSPPHGFDPAFFGPPRTPHGQEPARHPRVVAYAPSTGSGSVPERWIPVLRDLLARIDHLSVREASFARWLDQHLALHPAVVPDPAILYGPALLQGTEPSDGRGGVFAHALSEGALVGAVAQSAAKTLGLPVRAGYNPHRRWRQPGRTLHAGVGAWLQAIRGAELVVSNSFHATVVAALANVPFLACGLSGDRAQLSTRVRDFVASIGLSHRFVADPADAQGVIDRVLREPIDWESVNRSLAQQRAAGLAFLERAGL